MGNKPSVKEQKPTDRSERTLAQRGVLVPPSFGVSDETPSSYTPMTTTATTATTSSSLKALHRTSTAYRLLNQHMASGVWVAATTETGNSSVLASSEFSSSSSSLSSSSPTIRAIHHLSPSTCIQMKSSETPTGTISFGVIPSVLQLEGSLDTAGKGSVGFSWNVTPVLDRINKLHEGMKQRRENTSSSSSVEFYRNNPFDQLQEVAPPADEQQQQQQQQQQPSRLQCSAWLDLDLQTNKKSAPPLFDTIPKSFQTLHAHGSFETTGCTLAMESNIPLSTMEPSNTYHLSCDLNNSSGPPLYVDLYKTPTSSSMSLTQVHSFDRLVVNLLEDRCPKIRNRLGWTVQMTKIDGNDTKPDFQAGVAWQINRNVALKGTFNPGGSGMRAALVIKQWKEPRVICSILCGVQPFSFQGIGFELETGPRQQHQRELLYPTTNNNNKLDPSRVPETRATMPEE